MKKKIIALIFCVVLVAALVAGITMKSVFNKKGRLSNEKITVEQYKGLEVEVMNLEVSDEDVESSIKSTMDAMELGKKEEVKDRGAEYGDTIVMDYTGKKDGTPFDRGSDTDFEGVLGSIGFIDGFESAIVGHKAGETFDIDVTFPEDYQNKELAGQPVVFTIVLKKVSTTTYPELTDEVATKLNGADITVEEFRKKTREDLETSNKETAEAAVEQGVWQALIDKCVIDVYQEDALEGKKSEIEQRYGSMASYYSMDVETFVKNYYGLSVEDMAKDLLKQEYAIELIVEAEELEVTDEEYNEGLKKYAEESGYDSTNEDSLKEFEKLVTKSTLKQIILQEEVTKVLVDNCVRVKASK